MASLDTLPPELLERICWFLPPRIVMTKFVFVCKKFHAMFAVDEYWRSRLHKFDSSLAFPDSATSKTNFQWSKTCSIVETEQKRWTKWDKYSRHYSLTDGHIATVNSVHLMKDGNICISGSHDRCLCVWDLTRLPRSGDAASVFNTKDCLVFQEQKGHTGWIWTVDSVDDSVYTGAWDQKIIQWQLTPTELRPLTTKKCTAAVLCVVAEPSMIIASTFDRQIKLFDRRDSHDLIATLNHHNRAVLRVATDGDGRYIYSCGEDRAVMCYDRRMSGVVHRVLFPEYSLAMSYDDGQLWIGDMVGRLRLLDSDLTVLAQHQFGQDGSRRISDVRHNAGCVITASYDIATRKNASISIRTAGTRSRTVIDSPSWDSEPTKMDYRYGVLACGSVDSCVRVWIPSDEWDE